MNPCAAAGASTSTLPGASVKTAKENEFINTGGDMRMVKVEQNIKVTVNPCCTAEDDTSDIRDNAKSGSIVATNVFDIIGTLLGGIFGQKSSETNPISSDNIPQQSIPDHDAIDHSEPRAMVTETQDMMASPPLSVLDAVDAVNSMVSPLTQSSSSERYIRSMLEYSPGYPLYEPEPESQYCPEGVRVGDVGLITEDGGFDFLFNVCPTSDINLDELPDCFEMLRSPEILVKAHFQSGARLFNKEVKRTEEPDVKYTCSGPEGGVLELPLGATRFEAKNKRSFKRLATRHAENWYRYTILARERDAPNGSLYIVTACIKCTDWGIAVFDRPSNPEDYLRFITSEEDHNGRSKYRWKGPGAYVAKVAPNRDSAGSNDADVPDQCVFLRGYKIMLPQDIWDNITNSQSTGTTVSPHRRHSGNESESPRQGDSSNQDDPSQSSADNSPGSNCGTTRAGQNPCSRMDTSVRVVLYEDFKTSPAHPSDLVNAILLCQEPKANVALTHDDDWCDLLEYYSKILDSDVLAKVGLPYTSDVDEYGCVSLKRFDLNSSPSITVVDSSSDICVTPASENCLLIDSTTTNPTHKLPSMSDGLALIALQQDHPHPFNATRWSSVPYSQTNHHPISSTRVTGESDVNRAFAREDAGVDTGVMSLLPFGSFLCSRAETSTPSDPHIPTHEQPRKNDGSVFKQAQDFWPLSDAMTQLHTLHSQKCHCISCTKATVESDDHSFARQDMGVDTDVMGLLPSDSFIYSGAGPSAATTPQDQHPQRLKYYCCNHCSHKTKRLADMKRHRESLRHSSSAHKYVCDCGRRYTRKDSLTRHMKQHKISRFKSDDLTSKFTQQDPGSSMLHDLVSSTTAIVGSDVNRAFAREDVKADNDVMKLQSLDSSLLMHDRTETSLVTILSNLQTQYMSTPEQPSKDDGWVFQQETHCQPLIHAMATQSSTQHSQSSHYSILFETATTGSDLNLDESKDQFT